MNLEKQKHYQTPTLFGQVIKCTCLCRISSMMKFLTGIFTFYPPISDPLVVMKFVVANRPTGVRTPAAHRISLPSVRQEYDNGTAIKHDLTSTNIH